MGPPRPAAVHEDANREGLRPLTPDTERHLERIDWSPNPQRPPNVDAWPFTIPAVARLIADGGLEIPAGVTFLVGENGSGKSTLVEAMAAIYPRRGFESPFIDKTGPSGSSEDSPLLYHLRARTHRQASPAGFFLRAEMMHDYLAGVDAAGGRSRARPRGATNRCRHAPTASPS